MPLIIGLPSTGCRWWCFSLLVLFVAHIGERLSFGSRSLGAVVTALLFAVGFAVWSYGVDDAVNQAVAMVRSGPESR